MGSRSVLVCSTPPHYANDIPSGYLQHLPAAVLTTRESGRLVTLAVDMCSLCTPLLEQKTVLELHSCLYGMIVQVFLFLLLVIH